MPVRALAGRVAKMVNLQPVAALERARAPRKTQALATRPAADRVRLWSVKDARRFFPGAHLRRRAPFVARFALSSRVRFL